VSAALRRCAVVAVLAAGCAGGGEATSTTDDNVDSDRATAVETIADSVIAPAYHDLSQRSAGALDSARSLCAIPNDENLDSARRAISAAYDSYLRLDPIDFGPLMDLRAASQLGYRPDPDRIDALLADNPPVDAVTVGTRLPASARGFGAAEHLVASDLAEFTGAGTARPTPRCAYLIAVLEQASIVVASIHTGWFRAQPPFAEQVAGRGRDPIPTKEVIDILVNMTLEALGADSVALAAEARDGTVAPEFVRIATRHLETIAEIWGTRTEQRRLRATVGADLAERVAVELDVALAAARRGDATATLSAVDAVRATVGTEVVAALDVVVGFSENDGDS